MTVRVYVIGFNNKKRAWKALASIPDMYEKIFLDNGSIALKAPEGVELYAIGPGMFTDAFNWALRDAMERNAIPVICNDDIELETDCILNLLREIERGAGLACPIQVDANLPDNIIMGGTQQAYPAGIHITGQRDNFITKSRDFPWLPFCVVAVNPEVVRTCGYLDDNLKMWFSDSDYSLRVRAAGFSVMLVADAYVRHEHSASVKAGMSEKLEMQMVLDRAYFERKYGGQILEECK